MKRTVILLVAVFLTFSAMAQKSSPAPQYLTYNALLSMLGISGVDDADDQVLQRLGAYEFKTPDAEVNAKGGLLSVAVIKQGQVPKEYQKLLTQFFGIQPDTKNGRCILHPSFPAEWTFCRVHTPQLDYTFRRQGRQLTYEVTQRFGTPLTMVLRQNRGMGQYVEVTGSNQQQQLLTVDSPTQLTTVSYTSSYDDAALLAPGMEEPSFEGRFKTCRMVEWLTDSIRYDMQPGFIMDKEYIVKGVPFLVAQEGNNVAMINYPDTLTLKINARAERLWLLLWGNDISRDAHQSKAFAVAHYQDGTADILPLINPDNWGTMPKGSALRRCLPLNPDKKVVTLDVRPLAPDVKIGVMGVTLQD